MPMSALQYAALRGHTDVVRCYLVEDGVDVDSRDEEDGDTALLYAILHGHMRTAAVLLEAGANVNLADKHGHTPMSCACQYGLFGTAQLLSSYGASRTFDVAFYGTRQTAEQLATLHGHPKLAAWLRSSRDWSTPLHHISILSTARTLALLRAGASIHAEAKAGGPTPLTLACEMHARGEASEGTPAALVLQAAQPWSPATHALFPAAARAYAVQMMLRGHARSARLPMDVWMGVIMPHLVSREARGSE